MRDIRVWLPARFALTLTGILIVATTSCSRAAPTAADSLEFTGSPLSSVQSNPDTAVGSAASSTVRKASISSFDLTDGTFALTTAGGDRLTGRYTGRAEVSTKSATATLDLQVDAGSGAFQGARGTLRGDGKGAFTGEGAFWLSLDGSLWTAAQGGASHFHAVATGTARVSCVDGRVVVSPRGSGSATRFARVDLELRHEVNGASCTS